MLGRERSADNLAELIYTQDYVLFIRIIIIRVRTKNIA